MYGFSFSSVEHGLLSLNHKRLLRKNVTGFQNSLLHCIKVWVLPQKHETIQVSIIYTL